MRYLSRVAYYQESGCHQFLVRFPKKTIFVMNRLDLRFLNNSEELSYLKIVYFIFISHCLVPSGTL